MQFMYLMLIGSDAANVAAARMWEYKDLDGQTHGPFSSEKMRQWAARGYFQSDLQARASHEEWKASLSWLHKHLSHTAVTGRRCHPQCHSTA